MTKRNSEHMRLCNDRETGAHTLICLHCGCRQDIALPLPMTTYANILTFFAKAHQGCPPIPHIELRSETEAYCQRCQTTRRAISGAHIDQAAFVASHKDCAP